MKIFDRNTDQCLRTPLTTVYMVVTGDDQETYTVHAIFESEHQARRWARRWNFKNRHMPAWYRDARIEPMPFTPAGATMPRINTD